MKLSKLLKNVNVIRCENYSDCEINIVTEKSKLVTENCLFCCVVGEKFDAHLLVPNLVKKGCKNFLVQKIVTNLPSDVNQILVEDVRKEMCIIISNFYGNAHKKMKLIGVTGTNGKTTTTFILKDTLTKLGKSVGIIGTTGYYYNGNHFETNLTTPDVEDLHFIFRQMYDSGVEYVAMEVSAHAIYFNKIYGLKFEYGILTNITQDHLDFFKSMQEYANTKINFINTFCKVKLINIDDDYIKNANIKNVITFSNINNSKYFFKIINKNLNRIDFQLNYEDNEFNFSYPSCAVYNIYNAIPCIAILHYLGFDFDIIKSALSEISKVPGRLDFIKTHQCMVCIDYAHTPDALHNVLKTVKEFTDDLIVVFGSSGNRDSLKRKDMGKIVNEFANYIIITSDNPRYEREKDIIGDLSVNITKPYVIESNRSLAIKHSIDVAKENSIVVICGKGVENYQDIKSVKLKYSDYEEVNKYI